MNPRLLSWAFTLGFLSGCAIDLESRPLPTSHPASAESPESPYVAPPNLLAGELPLVSPKDGVSEPNHRGDHHHGAAAIKPYPLKTCLVGGEELGKMGKAETITYDGREIKFCCGACIPAFRKDPAKYLKILDEAEKKEKPKDPNAAPNHEHEEKK